MIPILSLIGIPNVGKSTIFDKVVLSDNIIDNFYGLTINKIYKISNICKYIFFLSDNKGIDIKLYKNNLNFNLYLNKSNVFLYIIDLYSNLNLNKEIINFVKKKNKYLFLIINKIDIKLKIDIFEILNLGLGKPYLISAISNFNIKNTIENILFLYCFNKNCLNKKIFKNNIKVSIIGNTNTGKSTLINFLIKENQILVSKKKNSTKDILCLNIKYKNYIITFIDTFGLKFKKYKYIRNNYFINKTLKNIIKSNIIILLLSNFSTDWDYNYIKFILNNGLNFIILISKSDLINLKKKIFLKNLIKINIKNEKFFIFFVSCLKKKNIFYILKYVIKVFLSSIIKINSNKLNKILKLYIYINKFFKSKIDNIYIHQAGKNPLIFILFSKNNFTKIEFFKKFLVKKLRIKSVGINLKNIRNN